MTRILLFILLFSLISKVNSQITFNPVFDSLTSSINSLYKQNKITKAIEQINKEITSNPNNGINYFNRAVLKFYNLPNSKYSFEIIGDCKKAITLMYKTSEVYYLLYSQYYNIFTEEFGTFGTFEVASGKFESQFEFLLKKIDSAIEKVTSWYTTNKYEKYLWTRIDLFRRYEITEFESYKENVPTLLKDCNNILDITKDKNKKYWAHFLLAESYKSYYADTIKAIKYYSAAIDLDVNKFNSYKERGNLRYEQNDLENAIEDFSQYLSKVKDYRDYEIFMKRAICYWILEKNNLALIDMNACISIIESIRLKMIKSENFSTFEIFYGYDWGRAYNLRGQNFSSLQNYKESLVDFNKAIECGNKDAQESKRKLVESLKLENTYNESSEINTF